MLTQEFAYTINENTNLFGIQFGTLAKQKPTYSIKLYSKRIIRKNFVYIYPETYICIESRTFLITDQILSTHIFTKSRSQQTTKYSNNKWMSHSCINIIQIWINVLMWIYNINVNKYNIKRQVSEHIRQFLSNEC